MDTDEQNSWLKRARRRTYLALEPSAQEAGRLSRANEFILVAIIVTAAIATLETEPTIRQGRETFFIVAMLVSAAIFLVEYGLRLWIVPENPEYKGKRLARLRYAGSPMALIDLAAIAPTLLTNLGGGFFLLRFARALRIIRLASLGRFSGAWLHIQEALSARRLELLFTLALGLLAMLIAATLMYWVEGGVQPDKFGSIPRSLWWAVVTLTTVGYGDVYPVTPAGKILAGAVSIVGIGVIAMPTGILAAAFSDALQRHRAEGEAVAAGGRTPDGARDAAATG
jgi:voltage-gated potassium channel